MAAFLYFSFLQQYLSLGMEDQVRWYLFLGRVGGGWPAPSSAHPLQAPRAEAALTCPAARQTPSLLGAHQHLQDRKSKGSESSHLQHGQRLVLGTDKSLGHIMSRDFSTMGGEICVSYPGPSLEFKRPAFYSLKP